MFRLSNCLSLSFLLTATAASAYSDTGKTEVQPPGTWKDFVALGKVNDKASFDAFFASHPPICGRLEDGSYCALVLINIPTDSAPGIVPTKRFVAMFRFETAVCRVTATGQIGSLSESGVYTTFARILGLGSEGEYISAGEKLNVASHRDWIDVSANICRLG